MRRKYVVIINGKPLSGKDTFISKCERYLLDTEYAECVSLSSIDPIKAVLKHLGWNGEKTDEVRNLLSMLKSYWVSNNDGPTGYIIGKILDCDSNDTYNSDYVIFVQIREPDEIQKLVDAMRALKPLNISVNTILISRTMTGKTYDNTSDTNVGDYVYGTYIDNNGTEQELVGKAHEFIEKLLGGK